MCEGGDTNISECEGCVVCVCVMGRDTKVPECERCNH